MNPAKKNHAKKTFLTYTLKTNHSKFDSPNAKSRSIIKNDLLMNNAKSGKTWEKIFAVTFHAVMRMKSQRKR